MTTANREVLFRKVSGDLPAFLHRYRKNFRSQFAGNPGHIVFVFFPIISTCAVNQQSARLETGPDVTQNALLTLPAQTDIVHAPFFDGHGIFTEHSFTRTGNIGEDDVEHRSQWREICRIIAGHNSGRVSPFHQILGQHLRAVPHDFVGNEQASLRQSGRSQCRLSPGSSTQVEHDRRTADIPAHHQIQAHRSSFLYIIDSGMKQRIKRKDRTFGQVITVAAPGHRFASGRNAG